MTPKDTKPLHQNGEQGCISKTRAVYIMALKIGPFNQIYKKEMKNRPIVCERSPTFMGERSVLTILLACRLEAAQKRPARVKNAHLSSQPPVAYTTGQTRTSNLGVSVVC